MCLALDGRYNTPSPRLVHYITIIIKLIITIYVYTICCLRGAPNARFMLSPTISFAAAAAAVAFTAVGVLDGCQQIAGWNPPFSDIRWSMINVCVHRTRRFSVKTIGKYNYKLYYGMYDHRRYHNIIIKYYYYYSYSCSLWNSLNPLHTLSSSFIAVCYITYTSVMALPPLSTPLFNMQLDEIRTH